MNAGTVRRKANLLGVGIDAVDMNEAIERVVLGAKRRVRSYVCVTGVHGIMEAQRDESLRRILNGSFLTTPDGVPTVWIGRIQGHRTMRRVYGPDLMLGVCERSLTTGQTHYLYGGAPGTVERLAKALRERFPGIRIVGLYTPPFRALTPIEERDLEERVAKARPDFFWVGLSTPKQERFMAKYQGRLEVGLFLGVGAAFDMNSGQLRQAPSWMQSAGLEWLFRLLMEPRRLAGRYLRNNPAFIGRIALQLAGVRSRSIDPA